MVNREESTEPVDPHTAQGHEVEEREGKTNYCHDCDKEFGQIA